jgi:tetratricopeptide (TPR) repeat protein
MTRQNTTEYPRAAPIMATPSVWCRLDAYAGLLAGLLALSVYAWTAAPSVTLLDSGELLLAAHQFGVPHATGYPLWTFLAWLWQLLPLGNPAWEIALFSGVLGALAVMLFSLLSSSMLRWFFPELPGRAVFFIAVGWGVLFALSEPMWSQATIAEVYTLHALLVGLLFVSLYGYIRNSRENWRLLRCFFFLALGFSNHHLVLALVPLPFLAVLLVRRRVFGDLLIASAITGLLFYLLFALLSREPATLTTSLRFTWLILAGFVAYVLWRRFRVRWNLVAFLPFVVAIGFLPYAYMPLASSTNPPMNWGYTSEREGFFYSINRSQYGGSLHEQLLRTAGRLVGTDVFLEKLKTSPKAPSEVKLPIEPGRLEAAQLWVANFWSRLAHSFSPLCLLLFFPALLLIREGDLTRRTWLYLLFSGFFLSAFLQPILDRATIDNAGWWVQMPYHTYSFMIFAWICVLGAGMFSNRIARRIPHAVLPTAVIWSVLAAWPWHFNFEIASQRNRWFGWFFGYEMLKDLPRGAIVFGGTDPGRFVPTWMIFGEGAVPAKFRRDPHFDRRDLYIITQNGLVDPRYIKYIRDHYAEGRPGVRNAFERWLGRGEAYPEKTLVLPTTEFVAGIVQEAVEKGQSDTEPHARIAEWIFEQNKNEHEFYLEESFPMPWCYDYAVPHGLVFKLEKEKLDRIPEEAVKKDFEFWNDLVTRFLADPLFVTDFDAKRSFSKLRLSIGNLYRHRKMKEEAKAAYRQALALYPANYEALMPLSNLLWDEGNFDEPIKLWKAAVEADPNSRVAVYFQVVAEKRREFQDQIDGFLAAIEKSPTDLEPRKQLVNTYLAVAEEEKANEAVEAMLAAMPDDTNAIVFALSTFARTGKKDRMFEAAKRWREVKPGDPEPALAVAAIALERGDNASFLDAAKAALQNGGLAARRRLLNDAAFRKAREVEGFETLMKPGQ